MVTFGAMKWLSAVIMAAALAGAPGCGDDSGETSTGGGGSGGSGGAGGGSPCDEDPANGPVPPECGVWVSASLGDDANPGTQDAPLKTLVKAVEQAGGGLGHVYACAETWTEPLIVGENVGIHGGFDCANGWAYLGTDSPSMLVVPPDEIALETVDNGNGILVRVSDFYLETPDAVTPGATAMTVFVRPNTHLHLDRCEVFAGRGADGADALAEELPAPAGPPGKGGSDACSAAVTKGGVSPVAACEGESSSGGVGGDGALMTAADGGDGEPASAAPADGAGGLGQKAAQACTNGANGASGADGAFGVGGGQEFVGNWGGRLTPEGYLGLYGEDGKPGLPGQGGGGGGATLGSTAVCGPATPGGAAGGSGGAGGCGGKGGKGGQPGGTSVAVAVLGFVSSMDCSYTGSDGGKGGNGAPGQAGGTGGAGAPGGAGAGGILPGCAGGAGGPGGSGGRGGGGLGGGAFAVAIVPGVTEAWELYDTTYKNGEPGMGGTGNPVTGEGNGRIGSVGAVGAFDP